MRCQACGAWTALRRRHCGVCGVKLSRRALCRQLFTAEPGADGAAPAPRPRGLASPRARILAAGIDVALAVLALGFVGALGHDPAFASGTPPLRVVVLAWVSVLAYPVLLEGATGQTVGKRAVGIRVVLEETGAVPGLRVAAHRGAARLAFGCVAFLALTDPLLRTLHDRSAGTVVVKVPAPAPSRGDPLLQGGGRG